MIISRASKASALRLTEIAHASKRHWGYPEEWIRLWRAALTFTPEFIEREEVHVAKRGEEIVGVVAVLDIGEEAEIEHLWVCPESMGQGIGRELMKLAMELARRWQKKGVRIVSDPHAVDFYAKFGAQKLGDIPATPEGRTLPLLQLKLD